MSPLITTPRATATLALAVAALVATPAAALAAGSTSGSGTSGTGTSGTGTAASPGSSPSSSTASTTTTPTSPAASSAPSGATPNPAGPGKTKSKEAERRAATLAAQKKATAAAPSKSPTKATAPSTAPTKAVAPANGAPSPRLVAGGSASSYGIAAPTGPAFSTDPTQVAAGYLVRQLVAGKDHFSTTAGGVAYADYGVTADAVLALDAAGAGQTEATRATSFLAVHVVDYTGFGDPKEIAAGSVAKLLNVAVAQRVDPHGFGGTDLVATLRSLEAPSGRFSDKSKYGDNSNTIGQSLAVLGLHRAGATVPAAAVAFLGKQQCADGGFRLLIDTKPCSSDPDATSFAVQALIPLQGVGDKSVQSGLRYLGGKQDARGAVGGGGPTSAPNANSTGLAGQAFLAAGWTAPARRAAGFLTTLQFGCSFPAPLRGGIAYDPAAYAAQRKLGAKAASSDQDRRATAQAILALARTPLGVVTATGADSTAPALACPAAPVTAPVVHPSPAPTSPAPTSPAPTSPAPTTPAPTSPAATSAGSTVESGAGATVESGAGAPVAAPTGELAFTGADVLPPVGLALLLLVVGAGAIVGARPRRKR